MASNNVLAVSSFVEGAPPGELADVVADIKALTLDEPTLLEDARPAFERYHEEQLTGITLSSKRTDVLISPYNSLGDSRYYDIGSQTSFAFDHITQRVSSEKPYTLRSQHLDLITALQRLLSGYASEHYSSSTSAVYPTASDSSLGILLVANKYSPSNFWNGRFRATYLYNPSAFSLTGTLKCTVHYYEDGNVRLTTSKSIPPTSIKSSTSVAAEILKTIASIEKQYQEELNKGFTKLSEGEFKALRRQLPITRQKVEWEKIGGYKLGQDIGAAGGGKLR